MIEKIENYAKTNNVPIMEKEGIDFLTNYIKENNIKSILEIGSAIGYSAIKFCLVSNDVTVTTVERDKNRYDMAVQNINDFKLKLFIFSLAILNLLISLSIVVTVISSLTKQNLIAE